jgi:2-methylisocitrate lyase-like PEP mutase family enzyme
MRIGPLVMPASKADAQGYGSAATYARRYSLLAAAGVVGEEDDDANAAVAKTNGKAEYITEKQAADLAALIEEVGETRERFLKWAKADSIQHIPATFLPKAIEKLEAKRGTAVN